MHGKAAYECMELSILHALLQQFVIVFTAMRKTIINVTDALHS